jgi:hypothetical protein
MCKEEAQREEATWQNEYSTPQKLACSQQRQHTASEAR